MPANDGDLQRTIEAIEAGETFESNGEEIRIGYRVTKLTDFQQEGVESILTIKEGRLVRCDLIEVKESFLATKPDE